jgi:hypothetical protein
VTTWPKINRTTWLALWAQGRRRRRQQHLLPAPVLRAVYPDLLRWDWHLPNPYKWNMWMSLDGGVTYVLVGDYWAYGAARQFAPDGGSELYYIVGVDTAGVEITEHSNLIRPDDAPVSLLTKLAGYWSMNEAAGHPRADASGNGWDLSEWSFQEATGSGYVSIDAVGGIISNAAEFGDGSGGKALVSFNPNTVLDGDFTFACWFNYNTSGGYDGQSLISLGGSMWIGIRAYDGAVNFGIRTDNADGYSQVQTDNNCFGEYQWVHAVFVKTADTLRIYLNGAESVSGPLEDGIVPQAAGFFGATDLLLGINPWGYPLIGLLDEVGCWQRALSAAEVGQLYHSGDGLAYEWF